MILLLEYSCKDECCCIWDRQDIPLLVKVYEENIATS